jgi:hypothetical protein
MNEPLEKKDLWRRKPLKVSLHIIKRIFSITLTMLLI